MLVVQRPGREDRLHLKVPLREVDWYEEPFYPGNPQSVPVLGLAYQVEPEIQQIIPDSPAAEEGSLAVGQRVVSANVLLPEGKADGAPMLREDSEPIQFTEEQPHWPFFFYLMQQFPPGTVVELETETGDKVSLEPAPVDDWFNPDRGLLLEQEKVVRQAESLAEAAVLGYDETVESLTMIYRTLRKMGTQISPKALGGPIEIFRAASRSASRGLAELLIFFCVLSANLAVLNFLPIPLLDGGHMVFLIYEGIRGKPADERVQLALTYVGLLLILALMVWVIGLDTGFISRQ
jgi:regulator of sigma E protease